MPSLPNDHRTKSTPVANAILVSQTQSWIFEAVQRRRARGVKAAVAEVARLYAMKERRVIGYLQGTITQVLASEWLTISENRKLELEQWVRKHREEAAALERELAVMMTSVPHDRRRAGSGDGGYVGEDRRRGKPAPCGVG